MNRTRESLDIALEELPRVSDLSPEAAQDEVKKLRAVIEHHDYLYYVRNHPVISDARYDALFARLQQLENRFPELAVANSPTRRVGAPPLESLKRVRHAAPMLSLNAAFEASDVTTFLETVRRADPQSAEQFVVEPKFDGVSVEVVYDRGEFVRGATRGDGETGEDVTDNLVAGEDPGSKLQEAREHGVRILNEEDFHQLIAGETLPP